MTDYNKIAKDVSDAIDYISKQGWKISYKTFDSVNKTIDVLSALKLFDLKYVFAENYTCDEVVDMYNLLSNDNVNEFYPALTLSDPMYFLFIFDRFKSNNFDIPEKPEPIETVKCFNIINKMRELGTYDNIAIAVL